MDAERLLLQQSIHETAVFKDLTHHAKTMINGMCCFLFEFTLACLVATGSKQYMQFPAVAPFLLFLVAFANAIGDASAELGCSVGSVVAQSAHEVEVSGCSSDVIALPDTGDDDFSPCCDIVTACYQICLAPKKQCDDLGKSCVTSLCKQTRERHGKCEAAKAVFAAKNSTVFDLRRFDLLRKASCACVGMTSVATRYVNQSRTILIRALSPMKVDERLTAIKTSLLRVAPENVSARGWRELLEVVRTAMKGLLRRSSENTKPNESKRQHQQRTPVDDDDL